MGQETLVVKLTSAQQTQLRSRLNAGAFEWRKVPHANFSVKGEGVVATQYRSGKLVVQGGDPQAFVARFVEGGQPVPKKAKARTERESEDDVAQLTVTTVGSDEAGKGDFFGPLVVAAVRLEPEVARKMAEGGVMDSKRLTDAKAFELGAALRATVPYSVVRVDPPEYNQRYPKYSGLNPFLADLHAEAIRAVAEPGVRVLVDRFANERLMKQALADLDIRLEQAPRAERKHGRGRGFHLGASGVPAGVARVERSGWGQPPQRGGPAHGRQRGALRRSARLRSPRTGRQTALQEYGEGACTDWVNLGCGTGCVGPGLTGRATSSGCSMPVGFGATLPAVVHLKQPMFASRVRRWMGPLGPRATSVQ